MNPHARHAIAALAFALAALAGRAASSAQEAAAGRSGGPTTQPAAVENGGQVTGDRGQAAAADVRNDINAHLVAGTMPQGAVPIEALVVEVKGRAQHAPVGTAVTDAAAWKPVQQNDRYPEGTLIRTGLGSHVTLQFGTEEPYTVVMVERMTLASITSLYKTQADKVSRVSVNYGAVRGGVSEGGLRSSFVVDSTVATLTKRGTWGFRMFVERGTGRFEVSLAEAGLVEALNEITRERQSLYSGQYVTQTMRRWVEQTSFDRAVMLQDPHGVTSDEFQFKALYGGGLAVLSPAATGQVWQEARPGYQTFVSEQVRLIQRQEALQLQQLRERLRDILNPGVIGRPEGDFNSRFR